MQRIALLAMLVGIMGVGCSSTGANIRAQTPDVYQAYAPQGMPQGGIQQTRAHSHPQHKLSQEAAGLMQNQFHTPYQQYGGSYNPTPVHSAAYNSPNPYAHFGDYSHCEQCRIENCRDPERCRLFHKKHPQHYHTYAYREPRNLVYPEPNQTGGVVVYPNYTHKGPDDFFLGMKSNR